jgi:hypothetical protein
MGEPQQVGGWAARAGAWVVTSAIAVCASAQVEVGAGSTLDLGTGTLEQGCSDLVVAGTVSLSMGELSGIGSLSIAPGGLLEGDAGQISWSGDWDDAGQLAAGSSTASWVDGCGVATSTMSAGEAFHSLALLTSQGREVRFGSGQVTTVEQSFTAAGAPGGLLRIRSTTPGSAAQLGLGASATQSVSDVDVADNHAAPRTLGFPGPAADYGSVKGPNSLGWFELGEGGAPEIPALSSAALVLLAAALALAALGQIARGSA